MNRYHAAMPGQTLSEIRGLLAAAGLAPQRRFGQNFLIDLNLMRKLIDAAALDPADVVLEVGAGTGSLTELLLDRGVRVVAVEIDYGLQAILRRRLGGHRRFTLIQGDALAGKHAVNPLVLQVLRVQPPEPNGVYKLVANLPYQIATPLIVELLRVEPRFERLTCTIQREVGMRLTAEPGTAEYGPVSVIVQTLADVEPVAILPPSVFWPRPLVESVMLTIRPKKREQVEVDDVAGFVALVHRGFAQRRKMLRRLIADADDAHAQLAFLRAGVNPEVRPEELSPDAWRALYRALSAIQTR
jgi:16S rRNA (adenine1518-N6/adenine1519-N6)-dimethyltransferase